MFDFVHENKRMVQIVLLLLILPSLALWGVSSYRQSGEGDALATVDGEKITQQEFKYALLEQQQKMMAMTQGRINPAVFDTPEVKHAILDKLIDDKLLAVKGRAAGLILSDAELYQLIAAEGMFQKDGKFDKQTYERVLSAQSLTPASYQSLIQERVAMGQLAEIFRDNGYASNAAADNLVRLKEQQRVVSVAQIAPDAFRSQVKVEEAAIKAYYESNRAEFAMPERARVEYVLFSAAALAPQMTADAKEINQYYKDHGAEFTSGAEQRHAAHILIAVSARASEADKKAAREKAESILKQVQEAPGNFAALAKKYSDDPGSAAKGGDLGFFGRGMMVPAFDDAVFSMKTGETSGLVQSDYGFHIIKLMEVKGAKMKPLEEVRASVAQRIKLQKAKDEFAGLEEKFKNAVYEQSDNLKPAAELVKVPVQQSDWLAKGRAGSPPWTDKALEAVFSDDVLKNKRNSSAVEVGRDTLLAVHLVEYKPADTRPLAEVSDAIRKKLELQQANELAVKQGQSLLSQLQHGETPKLNWGAAQTITWGAVLEKQSAGQDMELERRALRADAGKLPVYVGTESAQGGYVLARVDAVKDVGAIDEAKRAQELRELSQSSGYELLKAYLAGVKSHASISVKPFAAVAKD